MTKPYQAMRIGFLPKWPMSAYSASPPVTHSTTAPSPMKATSGWATKNWTAYIGFSATSTAGLARMWGSPSATSTQNHTRVIGPKNLPMPPVPKRCTANRPVSTSSVIGITQLCRLGAATSRPSTADSTEMAGVITPSP